MFGLSSPNSSVSIVKCTVSSIGSKILEIRPLDTLPSDSNFSLTGELPLRAKNRVEKELKKQLWIEFKFQWSILLNVRRFMKQIN